MNWVLILITIENFALSVPFDTQATCEAAKVKMYAYRSVKIADCFKK